MIMIGRGKSTLDTVVDAIAAAQGRRHIVADQNPDKGFYVVSRFADVFAGYDAVVTPSGSCASMVRRYHPVVAALDAVARMDPTLPDRVAAVDKDRGRGRGRP